MLQVLFKREARFFFLLFLKQKLELKALILKVSVRWPFRQVGFHVMSKARDRNVFT